MKELQQYTYTIPANGSVQIPASNDNFIIQASTGPLAVRGDTFGRLRGMVAGQGLKMVPFERLELFDESGAPNTVTLLMTPAEFVNQTFSGSVTIVGAQSLDSATILALGRPEEAAAAWNSNATMVANTPIQIFAPGANVNGAIVWAAEASDVSASNVQQSFIAKASAPTSPYDGQIIALSQIGALGANIANNCKLDRPVRLLPGRGLYFISGFAGLAGFGRHASYSLL